MANAYTKGWTPGAGNGWNPLPDDQYTDANTNRNAFAINAPTSAGFSGSTQYTSAGISNPGALHPGYSDPTGSNTDYAQNPQLSNSWSAGTGHGWQTTPRGPTSTGGAPDPGKGSDYSHPDRTQPGGGGDSGGPTDYPLADPGYNEDFYKKYGQDLVNTPSASEDLYAKGAAGSNPFYDYAQQETIKAINDASAARGDFNSSYTMRNIGNAVADLRGQQAHELGQLAGQADSAKLGRYNASEGYSADAQHAMEGRANAGLDRQMSISNNEANQVGGFYGKAGDESQQAEMARIETYLKQAGLSAEETKQALALFGQLGGDALKAFA